MKCQQEATKGLKTQVDYQCKHVMEEKPKNFLQKRGENRLLKPTFRKTS